MPVVVVVVVLSHVLGGNAPSGTPATVSGPTTSDRADLRVLTVDVPPVTPRAAASCPALMQKLPVELIGDQARRVKSASPFAYAWGDPPVVLRCGVPAPKGFVRGAALIQINGVQWYVDTSDPDTTVWTAVDRPVYVEVRLPSSVDSAPVTSLTAQISATLPFREPTPGR